MSATPGSAHVHAHGEGIIRVRGTYYIDGPLPSQIGGYRCTWKAARWFTIKASIMRSDRR